MKRILVVGPPGSGKSTLARALGEIMELPVVHLDLLWWNPGWVETPFEEFERKVEHALSGDRWVCDGNYSRTFSRRLARADAVVFLDIARRTCIRRVLMRAGKARPDLPPDCPERRLSRDYWAFLKWTWTYNERSRPRIMGELQAAWNDKTIYHLRHPREVERFVDGLRRARSG